ncbi:MAG: tetratricopeptide repeat protein [Nitrospira sp.]|nr:tetratricopeptide repeat protein [Nitrospira sp.]
MKYLLCLLLFTFYCSLSFGGDIDGKALLKKGRNELENRKYEDAIVSLSAAEKEFPLLGDYALLWLSEAYHEIGKHGESLNAIRTLLNKYPNSPIKKKTRINEVKEAEEVSEENLQQTFESFLKEYPDTTEIKYLYARWLKKNDKKDLAKPIFKELYIDAGLYSEKAYNELIPSDITVEDLIKRSSNLMKLMDFKGAETILKSALEKDDVSLKNEILKSLGLSLFRQKRYREAAEFYKKADEKYWEVRSLYRAGEKEAFDTVLKELLKSGDKKAGPILITVASDRRKDGKIEEAIKIYQDVIKQFSAETEDALWGIGWTYFLTGDYKKSSETFTKLSQNYNDTKYLYWKARSLEASGEKALDIYQTIMKKDRDFYSIMSYVRMKKSSTESITKETNISNDKIKNNGTNPSKSPHTPLWERGAGGDFNEKAVDVIPVASKRNDRVEVLIEIGLSKEALLELIQISKATSSVDDLLYIALKFQELGDYQYMVNLTERLSCAEKMRSLCYPRAYWDTVEPLSRKHSVDPFLILSVVREESKFDLNARSNAGALGLMQLIPQTAYRLDNKLKLGITSASKIYNPNENLNLGTYYLSTLIKEFGSYSYAIAAYNAGEETVRRWIQKGNYKSADEFIEDIPYNETRNYVKRVLTTLFEYKRIYPEEGDTKEISLENI